MDLQLKGKRAFISGSSAGIGQAIAMELAAEGVNVVVHGRDKARAEQTAHEAEKLGVKAAVAIGDLAKDADADKICKVALAAFGGTIDIAVNNCGYVFHKDAPSWVTLPVEEWLTSLHLNFLAALRVSQRLAPGMQAQKWGRIINISTASSVFVGAGGALSDYGSAKAALNKFTADISKNLGPDNITVNAIIPGTVWTPAVKDYFEIMKKKHNWGNDQAENERDYTTRLYPQSVPRLGRVRDVGAVVTFLSSPLAGYINGTFLRVDGGMANFM